MGPQIASQIAVSIVGGPAAGMMFMGSQIAGSSYEKNKQDLTQNVEFLKQVADRLGLWVE